MARLRARLLSAVVLAGLALPTPAGADEAWRERVGQELARLETSVAEVDAKAPAGGSLVERAAALHARIAALEVASGLQSGAPPEATEDLASLTQAVARLTTRWKDVLKARNPEPEVPAGPPTPLPEVEKPVAPKRQGVQWPPAIEFSVKANLHHEAIGEWYRDPYVAYPFGPYGYSSYFQVTGHRGVLSFTLGAKDLPREVKEARILVVVHLQGPFATTLEGTRRYEVDWVPERVIGDGAWKRWNGFDTIEIPAHGRLTSAPRPQVTNLRAEAHVISVLTKEGERVGFETPQARQVVLGSASPTPAESLSDVLVAMPERYDGQTVVLERMTLDGEMERVGAARFALGVTTETGTFVPARLRPGAVTFVASSALVARLVDAGVRAGARYPVRLTVTVARRAPHWVAAVRKVEFVSADGSRVLASVSE